MGSDAVWIVLMNASRARVLRGVPGAAVPPQPDLPLRSTHRRLRRLLADAPGLGPGDAGGVPSPPPPGADPLRRDQEDFVRRVIDLLATHLAAGDFAALAVFAEPGSLRLLRDLAPEPLARRIVAERPLALLHLPRPEMARAIRRELGFEGRTPLPAPPGGRPRPAARVPPLTAIIAPHRPAPRIGPPAQRRGAMQDAGGIDLNVPLDTVCYIVERAHDLQGKTARADTADTDADIASAVLEESPDDPVAAELATVISDLDVDAQIDLVALMWLGRDPAGEWAELREIARQEHTGHTARYLCGTPLLADYLLAGLERLGLDCSDWLERSEL